MEYKKILTKLNNANTGLEEAYALLNNSDHRKELLDIISFLDNVTDKIYREMERQN